MSRQGPLIVGIDIGTTKTVCVIGEVRDDNLDIIGFGMSESTGIRKGVVINPEATSDSIQEAVSNAELMAGCKAHSAVVSIGGEHLRGHSGSGMVALKEEEVTEKSIEAVIEAASALPELKGREVIHVMPQHYLVDFKNETRHPIGVTGVRLDAHAHIVSAGKDSCENIIKCVEDCGVRVERLIAEPIASACAVLTDEEKDLGVAVLDIGGGTTDISVYFEGALVHTDVIGIGGNNINIDISTALHCSVKTAEEMKFRHAIAILMKNDKITNIEVPLQNRPPQIVSSKEFQIAVQLRVKEIVELAIESIEAAGYRDALKAGLVITGGTSKLTNMIFLCEALFNGKARLGTPRGKIGGLVDVVEDPMYTTAVGLLLFQQFNQDFAAKSREDKEGGVKRFFSNIFGYFNQAF